MLNITSRVQIAASPAKVFNFLEIPENWLKFASGLVDVQPRQPLTLGATGYYARAQGRSVAKNNFEVVEFVPNRKLVMKVSASWMTARDETVLAEAPNGTTQATFSETLVPHSLGGHIMLALFGWLIRKSLRDDYARLKSVLEANQGNG